MQSASNGKMENNTDTINEQNPVDQIVKIEVKEEPFESCNQNPLNGSIVDPSVELDYEDDFIMEKQDDFCKKNQDEDVERANAESDAEKLIVYCTQEEIESPIVENQSPEKNLEISEVDDKDEGEISDDDDTAAEGLDGELPDEEELEEGEVKEPVTPATQQIARQVCRFFNNGNCTWGNQCRFLHLSLKDHGCYNMFGTPSNKVYIPHILHPNDIPLVIPPHHDLRSSREIRRPPPSKPPNPPPAQTAWDYGLQCAKEALEISNQRKKQEFDYEDKKLNLKSEESERVIDNKENYDYVKPYRQQIENFHLNKYEEPKDCRDLFPPSRKTWIREEELQRPMKRNIQSQSRDKQLSEIQSARPRGDEWRDPWRRSLSPKNRQKRKRDLSSCSSVSSDSYSSRSSSSPCSSRSSSVTSRSASYDRPYYKNKNLKEDQRKMSSHEMRQSFNFKEKEKQLYSRKLQRPSRAPLQRNVYRSPSSKSRSHSPSLSNVSSASSCSSSSHARNRNEKIVEKVVIKPKPKKKPAQPTRTLFEEMQRLVQHRQRSDAQKAEPSEPCATTSYQSIPNTKVVQRKSTPETDKIETEHVKSIGIRRIKLMKQLQAVEDAIARKRQKI